MEVLDIALYPMVRCCDVPDALRLSDLQNTFSPAPVGRIRQSRHPATQTARSHDKEKQEYKEGIYKRRKAKTQP